MLHGQGETVILAEDASQVLPLLYLMLEGRCYRGLTALVGNVLWKTSEKCLLLWVLSCLSSGLSCGSPLTS
jgi:hypothetical protein